MDWRSLALKSIWRNMRRYLSYLLASSLAVAVFSLFFIFIFNPHVYALAAAQMVAVVLILCIFIVAWFAVFFIFYFHSSLIRVRNKEFGLLMTLGMTPRQIGRLIFLESVCIALAAIVLGIMLGVLGSLPFATALGAVLALQDAIPFMLSPWAILVTAVFFVPVFLVEALLTSWRIARRTPRVLILGSRTQQTPPKASWLKVILSLLCLGIAYDQAIQFSDKFVLNAIPIVILTMIGTFLLFGQAMVMLLSRLRHLPLHGVHLLIVSRLAYRLKDYARMLAVVTILSASVLTGMGAVYGFLQAARSDFQQSSLMDIQLAENVAQPGPLTFQDIRNRLQAQKLIAQTHIEASLVDGQVNNQPLTVMSASTFANLRSTIVHFHPELASNLTETVPLATQQAYLLEPAQNPLRHSNSAQTFQLPAKHSVQLQVGSASAPLQIEQHEARILNQNIGVPEFTLVINDQLYASLSKAARAEHKWYVLGLQFANAQQITMAVNTLQHQVGTLQSEALRSVQSNIFTVQLLATLLFAGCFVSALFLIAAGSSLYFKLFTQQEEDQRQFYALARVGLQKREAVRIISSEFFLLFFLPVLVAAIHSGVATLDLIFLMRATGPIVQIIWSALGVTCLVYTACFAGYYLVALLNYFRRVQVMST